MYLKDDILRAVLCILVPLTSRDLLHALDTRNHLAFIISYLKVQNQYERFSML